MPTAPKADPNVLKKPPPRFFTAWSYSRWNDHSDVESGCPRRAALKHLYKIPEGDGNSPAMERGARIHKLAEDYVKGLIKRLPAELANFKEEFAQLRKIKATPEGKWGISIDWKPADFFDWDKCWLRVVLDVHHLVTPKRAKVIDHKTGKVYGTNEDQLELYALGGFAYYPAVDEVETELWYLDQGLIKPDAEKDRVFKRKEAPKLQKKWRERVIPMLTDRKFIPRPGPHCHRCAYRKARGGPCEFGG